jgi:hypothetical protein
MQVTQMDNGHLKIIDNWMILVFKLKYSHREEFVLVLRSHMWNIHIYTSQNILTIGMKLRIIFLLHNTSSSRCTGR